MRGVGRDGRMPHKVSVHPARVEVSIHQTRREAPVRQGKVGVHVRRTRVEARVRRGRIRARGTPMRRVVRVHRSRVEILVRQDRIIAGLSRDMDRGRIGLAINPPRMLRIAPKHRRPSRTRSMVRMS